MNKIKYIQAGTTHISLLVDSRIEFLTEHCGGHPGDVVKKLRSELSTFFEREIASGTYVSWMAFDSERLVGVGGMKIYGIPGNFRVPEGKVGYILSMYTVKSHRRQGIAGEIVNRLVQTGSEAGVRLFDLHASKLGESVYKKVGFSLHDEPGYRKIVTDKNINL